MSASPDQAVSYYGGGVISVANLEEMGDSILSSSSRSLKFVYLSNLTPGTLWSFATFM